MPEQLTNKELRWGYWYFLHRGIIRRVGVSALAAFGIGLLLYSGWQWIDWLASRKAEEESLRLMVATNVNFAEYRRRNAPIPLEVGTVTAIPSGTGRYDLIAQVKNPNIRWGIWNMPFTFQADSSSFTGASYIMPLEDKFIVSLGATLPQRPQRVSVSFGALGWNHLRADRELKLPNFKVAGEQISASEGVGTSLRFTLENNSPYGFYEVGVVVVLTRSGTPVAVGRQVLSSMASGEHRPVEFTWPQLAGTPDRLTVKPEVNVFDAKTFKPL